MILKIRPGRAKEVRQGFEQSSMFEVDEWEASMTDAPFLDTTIFKGDDNHITHRLSHKPKWKQTSLGVPLALSSIHHPSVHMSWMQGEIRRLARLSSTYEYFEFAKQTFLDRLCSFHMPSRVVETLRDYDPYMQAVMRQCLGCTRLPTTKVQKLVMVLPFHRNLHKAGINKVLAEFMQNRRLQDLLRQVMPNWQHESCMLSWRLSEQHLKDSVRWFALSGGTVGKDGG